MRQCEPRRTPWHASAPLTSPLPAPARTRSSKSHFGAAGTSTPTIAVRGGSMPSMAQPTRLRWRPTMQARPRPMSVRAGSHRPGRANYLQSKHFVLQIVCPGAQSPLTVPRQAFRLCSFRASPWDPARPEFPRIIPSTSRFRRAGAICLPFSIALRRARAFRAFRRCLFERDMATS